MYIYIGRIKYWVIGLYYNGGACRSMNRCMGENGGSGLGDMGADLHLHASE